MIARRHVLGSLVVTVAVLAAAGCSMMDSSKPMMAGTSMTIALNGANEVPPKSPAGTGTAKVTLEGNVLKWTVTYEGMTGPVTAAHFHGPAAAGSNAGVVVPFVPPLASPITGTVNLTAAQVADLQAGLWYINLHTAANPGGEIRGQVK
jgi:hypothetical protein